SGPVSSLRRLPRLPPSGDLPPARMDHLPETPIPPASLRIEKTHGFIAQRVGQGMQLELSKKELRRLRDKVYDGNWILNSTRGEDRFQDYDHVESLLFEKARQEGMGILAETYRGQTIPSRAFVEGGIHEAIMEYEN